jgi:hypothetical protein
LRPVTGTVTGVTEVGGKSPRYALDVRTATGNLHVTFASDSPMLGTVIDGDPADVTLWRGIPVSLTAVGRTEATATVPATAFAQNLGECGAAGGLGVMLVLVAGQRRKPWGPDFMRAHPGAAAGVLALIFGDLVIMIGGAFLVGKPSALVPDLVISGAALLVVIGACAWLRITVSSRARRHLAARGPGASGMTDDARIVHAAGTPGEARPRTRVMQLRARLQASWRAPMLAPRGPEWAMPVLVVAVLFGIFFTVMNGPHARAYRDAPACAGETNLATCAGDFTATIDGVRTSPSSANFASVRYLTGDGVIRIWVGFIGDGAALARMAQADESESTPVTIRVWRRAIVGAELGGTWHWPKTIRRATRSR